MDVPFYNGLSLPYFDFLVGQLFNLSSATSFRKHKLIIYEIFFKEFLGSIFVFLKLRDNFSIDTENFCRIMLKSVCLPCVSYFLQAHLIIPTFFIACPDRVKQTDVSQTSRMQI